MIKYLIYYFILGLLFTNCAAKYTIGNQNHQTNETIFQNETKLPKEIFLLIGRGGCCNGHIVSISKNGEIKYFVGTYSIPNASSDMPEIYDSQLITQNPNYKPKYRKLSEEKIIHLKQLINDEQKLRFKDEVLVTDDFVYNIYLNNKKIASGYQSHKAKFPTNLAELIDLIRGEVELYNLPGMA
ncbi:MAG: hypothetical protein WKF92_06140 [Pyrinomonadaceae bacterium]